MPGTVWPALYPLRGSPRTPLHGVRSTGCFALRARASTRSEPLAALSCFVSHTTDAPRCAVGGCHERCADDHAGGLDVGCRLIGPISHRAPSRLRAECRWYTTTARTGCCAMRCDSAGGRSVSRSVSIRADVRAPGVAQSSAKQSVPPTRQTSRAFWGYCDAKHPVWVSAGAGACPVDRSHVSKVE